MKKIDSFLYKNHIMNICGSYANIPYCATCFYAYKKYIYFASDPETLHIKIFEKNPIVSGTIYLDTKNISKIKGIQFQGKFLGECKKEEKEIYFKKFPFSKILNPKIYKIEPIFLKYTDNSIGFGKKKIIGKSLIDFS